MMVAFAYMVIQICSRKPKRSYGAEFLGVESKAPSTAHPTECVHGHTSRVHTKWSYKRTLFTYDARRDVGDIQLPLGVSAAESERERGLRVISNPKKKSVERTKRRTEIKVTSRHFNDCHQ